MKKLLSLVSFVICFMLFCFVPQTSVYAVNISDINEYFSVQDKFYQILKQNADFMTSQEEQTKILNRMYDILENNGYNGSRSGQGLSDNGFVSVNSNGDIELSVDLQNALRSSIDYWIQNDTGSKYVYSTNGSSLLSLMDSQTKFNGALDILSNNRYCFYERAYGRIHVIDESSLASGYLDFVYVGGYANNYQVSLYSDWSNQGIKEFVYTWSDSGNTWTPTASQNLSGFYYCVFKDNYGIEPPYYTGSDIWLINLNVTQYIMYNSVDAMRADQSGLQEYYVGNDFSTSSVSTVQTITDSMLNSSISYSDISNYVNNYYVTNQTYPSSQDTYNYINNYNGSGGGSGGGSGDDNGNGSDNSNIWDFLDSIGEFIGHLISSLGEVLSGILSLLTDVIDLFIGEDGLPNVFSQLVSYYLGFLPEEFLRLIELFVVCVLIVGVIKLIRGS